MDNATALTLAHTQALAAAEALESAEQELDRVGLADDPRAAKATLRRARAYLRIGGFHLELTALIARVPADGEAAEYAATPSFDALLPFRGKSDARKLLDAVASHGYTGSGEHGSNEW